MGNEDFGLTWFNMYLYASYFSSADYIAQDDCMVKE